MMFSASPFHVSLHPNTPFQNHKHIGLSTYSCTCNRDRKLEEKYFVNSTRKYPSRCWMSIPPRHCRIDPSFIATLTDWWFLLMSWFWGTALMSVWISARTVHMCQDVLVMEFVGLLGACIKWMSSSMRSRKVYYLISKETEVV
ncbi:hypothetical protein ACROYT_G002043 [Oculina patagonica]